MEKFTNMILEMVVHHQNVRFKSKSSAIFSTSSTSSFVTSHANIVQISPEEKEGFIDINLVIIVINVNTMKFYFL